MKEKLKTLISTVRGKKFALLGAVSAAVIANPTFASAATIESAKKAAEGTTNFVQNITKSIIPIIVVAMGVALLIGGQRAREGVKEGAAFKIMGLILIFGAIVIGKTIAGWF